MNQTSNMKNILPATMFFYDPYFSIYSTTSSAIGSSPLEELITLRLNSGLLVDYAFDEEVKDGEKVGWLYFPVDPWKINGLTSVVIWNE